MRELKQSDVSFEAMRSGGPGGQHSDRAATAVRLRVPIEDLPLSETEIDYVKEYLPPKNRTKDNELIVQSGKTRSQARNRERALKIARDEIDKAIRAGKQARKKKEYKKRTRGSGGGGGGSGREDIHEERKKRRRRETTDDLLEQALEEAPEIFERSSRDDVEDNKSDDDANE